MTISIPFYPERIKFVEDKVKIESKSYENGFVVCTINLEDDMAALRLFQAGVDVGIHMTQSWQTQGTL